MTRARHAAAGDAGAPQVAMFRFTLAPRQSIGPAQLHALWAGACQSPNVSVGRHQDPRGDRPTYSLYASQRLENLPQVERRLREAFDRHQLHASLVPMHAG